MIDKEYLEKKRLEILEKIKPVCEAFKITNYDYILDNQKGYTREFLIINGTKIGCSGNSILAVENELLAYIFINKYCRYRSLGAFEKQVKNVITQYWVKEG